MKHKLYMRTVYLAFAFILLSGHYMMAQDSTAKQLSLKEAVDLALKNSKQLKSNRAMFVKRGTGACPISKSVDHT
jgi:hypothetical protein